MHWSASVDNEKSTALLLKNNAKKDAQDSKVSYCEKIDVITLDFSSLLKNHFECSFVSSDVRCKVPMFVLKFVPSIYDD